MLRIASAIGLILSSALLVIGCGGGSDSSSPPTTKDPRSVNELAEDRVAATGSLLTLADLPAGWEATPNPTAARSSEQRAAENAFAKCADVDPSVIGAGAESGAHAQSDEFSDGTHEIENSVTVVATKARAEAQLAAIRKPEVQTCLGEFVNRAIESAINNPEAGQSRPEGVSFGKAQVEVLNVPGLQAESVAYRAKLPVTVEGQTADVNFDIVLALKGRTGVLLSFTSFGAPFPVEQAADLTNKVIARAPSS